MDNQLRTSLFDTLSLKRKSNENKSYIERLIIPMCVFVLLAVILISLSLHVLNYGGITKSTKIRQKGQGNITECKITYTEDDEFDTQVLKTAMDYFASKTGVMPNIYICSEYGGDAESLFLRYGSAENCFFIVYEIADGSVNAVISDDAISVIDSEAYDIFCDYIDYYKSITEDTCKILEYTYKSTADRIMVKTDIFNCVSVRYYIGIILMIISEFFLALKMLNEIKKRNGITGG